MVNLKKILVPIDFTRYSVKGMEYALSLAAMTKSEILVLHVIKPLQNQFAGLDESALAYLSKVVSPEAMEEKLDSWLKENFDLGSTKVSKMVRPGEPIGETIEVSKSAEADLIVVCTKGLTGFSKVLMTSFAENLMRNSQLPVLVVKF